MAEREVEQLAAHSPNARPGKNAAGIHGLYRVKSKDPVKAQRIRRRVNRKWAGLKDPVLRQVMRPVTYAMCELEDRLAVMRDYLDEKGLLNEKDEPRRLVTEYRQYWKLWLDLAAANGMTLVSFMATRRDSLEGDDLAARAAKLRNGGE